jgi:hypothetical protein
MANVMEFARSARDRMADAFMEMKQATFVEALPFDDDAIIAQEETDTGWRALTARGEIFDVRNRNGTKAVMPTDDEGLTIVRGGAAPIRPARSLREKLRIQDYLTHFNGALALTRANQNEEALTEIDAALALAPTLYARFNRAMILLALGRWREGFDEYRQCEMRQPFIRQRVADAVAAGLKVWNGEEIAGKRLLLLHAHGFGDTLMALRFVPTLRAIGADVKLTVPAELTALAAPFALVTDALDDCDFVCPLLHVLGMLSVVPEHVGGNPYLHVDAAAVARARGRLGPGRHVGIAWSTAVQRPEDYQRTIPLNKLVGALGDARLHSVQKHGALEALAHGVRVHPLDNFADCAALMLAMDRIISVDTAALHLAGAIGHPRVEALLGHWASWRWLAPWYANTKLHRQTRADDWDSALAQLEASDGST